MPTPGFDCHIHPMKRPDLSRSLAPMCQTSTGPPTPGTVVSFATTSRVVALETVDHVVVLRVEQPAQLIAPAGRSASMLAVDVRDL